MEDKERESRVPCKKRKSILSDSGSFSDHQDPQIINSCSGSDLSAKESQENTATHPPKKIKHCFDDPFNRNYWRDISFYRWLRGRSTTVTRKGNKDERKDSDNELHRKDDDVFSFHNQSSNHGTAKRNEQRDPLAGEICEGGGDRSAAAGGRSVGHVGTSASGALDGCGGGGCSEAPAQRPASRIRLFGCDIDGNDGGSGIAGASAGIGEERPPPRFLIRLFGVDLYGSDSGVSGGTSRDFSF